MIRDITRRTHLVTGATGLVGGALILELLDNTDDAIVALVRPGADGDAQARLMSSLREAVAVYGRNPALIPFHRVRALAGDIARPGCGIGEPPVRAHVMWHAAASLRYEDRHAVEIFRINVEGTRNALDLARRAGATHFNMISTAFVSGAATGRLMEVAYEGGGINQYQKSKIAAEALVLGCDDFVVRLLRPSVVVGHSRTLAVTTFSGLYGFAKCMAAARDMLEREQPGLSRRRRLRICADPSVPIDFIPVDELAAQAVHIGLRDDAAGVYNLTHADAPTIGETLRGIAMALGMALPEFVADEAALDPLERKFCRRTDYYNHYLRTPRQYDRTRADAALGGRRDLYRKLPKVRDLVVWYAVKTGQAARPMALAA
jgi:nucleoside-diphosphate-sugar epimerase